MIVRIGGRRGVAGAGDREAVVVGVEAEAVHRARPAAAGRLREARVRGVDRVEHRLPRRDAVPAEAPREALRRLTVVPIYDERGPVRARADPVLDVVERSDGCPVDGRRTTQKENETTEEVTHRTPALCGPVAGPQTRPSAARTCGGEGEASDAMGSRRAGRRRA